jgi:hypothetical protein
MRRILVCAVLVALSVSLQATVLVPIEFRELVNSAPVIVAGRVVDVRTEWVDGRRSIETFVTVTAGEYLKGNLGDTLTLRVPGGQIGRYRTIFVGAPEFKQGDEVVLFLKHAGPSYPYIVGLSQGAFRVVTEPATGRRMVTTPIVMGSGGEAPERVVRGDPGRRPLSMERFREAVREVMTSGAAR